MSKEFQNLKGTYDYLPERQILRENIKSTLQSIFIKYGFAPVETPILCGYDLLASKYSEGADILNETYKLTDQGKRSLGLRYDLTITFSKLISFNPSMTMPFKRYEIGKVFRDGPVKLGRNREFTQCDIDCVGTSSLLAEAEYMTMTEEAYRQLGLDIEILYNNRKLLNGLITAVFGEVDETVLRQSIMLIDKFAKLTKKELVYEFSKIGISEEKVDEISAVLALPFDELCQKITEYPHNQMIEDGIKEIKELQGYLQGTKAFERMTLAAYLARGIDVYTGTVWEVVLRERKVGDVDFGLSIGGGGRYDKIITAFIDDGKEYPAVGMSFGLDVIYEIMKIQSQGAKTSVVDLFVIPMGTVEQSFRYATELRNRGVKVELEKKNQKVGKSMGYADKMNIPFAVVLGENEIESGEMRIKNLQTGEQTSFKMDDYDAIIAHVTK